MFRIVGILLFLCILAIGLEFSAVNSAPVTVNYFLGSMDLPLALVIVAAFTLGIIVAVLVGATVVLPLRLRAGAMRREIEARQFELDRLRAGNKPS
ncbi:LapA family protein [Plasticicumulans acidivorans]|uniref:Putative integral membrane protein n=1 Tax=Plasticicumulans acidivorans TaxID=886464 RepID=A0A317MSF1_9GAMM|nr:LapA family protein [Plasticicumulans acidivorans]PWV59493.1 putative integral membrane protein [Plasticicumulans acidivorans]